MTKQQHARHAILVVLTVLGSVLVEVLAPAGALGHYHWSATALAVVAWGVRALNLRMPPPTTAAAFLLALPFLGGATCIKTPVTPPGDGGTLTDCSLAAIHGAELGIVGDVESALAQTDFSGVESALASVAAKLAVTTGLSTATALVTCVVQWAQHEASGLAVAPYKEPLEQLKVANAQKWLQLHGAQTTGTFTP